MASERRGAPAAHRVAGDWQVDWQLDRQMEWRRAVAAEEACTRRRYRRSQPLLLERGRR